MTLLKDASNNVHFVGFDYWGRSLFEGNTSGVVIVDVDGELHTITDEGEPCTPLGYATPKTVIGCIS